MLSLRQVTADGYSKIFGIKFLDVDIVVCAEWMSLVGDSQYFTFVGVE